VIGIIDLISPALARQCYRLNEHRYFIEFYLSSKATRCYIKTDILPLVVESFSAQGITRIGAVINRKNQAAKRVLEKARFVYQDQFDPLGDLYLVSHY
jgi:RimJ/RimL family protein N-acetyltransferase